VSSISLCGFPFLTGFYSKDLIIEMFYINKMNLFIILVLFVSTLLTLIYSIRLIYYLYVVNRFSGPLSLLDENIEIYYPIFFLFIFSIIVGSFFCWLYFPTFFIIIRFSIKTSLPLFLIFSLLIFF